MEAEDVMLLVGVGLIVATVIGLLVVLTLVSAWWVSVLCWTFAIGVGLVLLQAGQ